MTRAPSGFSLGSAPTRAGPVHARQGGDRLRAQAWNNAADSHTVGPPICEFTRYLCDIASQLSSASLSAELTRREKILAAAGVKDIEDYTERAVARAPPPAPAPAGDRDRRAGPVRPDRPSGCAAAAARGDQPGVLALLSTGDGTLVTIAVPAC